MSDDVIIAVCGEPCTDVEGNFTERTCTLPPSTVRSENLSNILLGGTLAYFLLQIRNSLSLKFVFVYFCKVEMKYAKLMYRMGMLCQSQSNSLISPVRRLTSQQ